MAGAFGTGFLALHKWLRVHGEFIGFAGLLSGAALGLGIPLWQTYWVDTPRLSVEIYSIDRQISADARIPVDDDAISLLTRSSAVTLLEDRFSVGGGISAFSPELRAINRNGYTTKEASELIIRARQELRSSPEKIEERQRQLREVEFLSPERLTVGDIVKFNGPISPEYKANPAVVGQATVEGIAERQKAIEHFKKEYLRRLEITQKRYAELQAQLPGAERRIDELKREIEDKKSYFQITTILSNAGRKSISIRQLALLRVYIGRGNYVDLRLSLKDVQTAEVGVNGTRIATFTSDLLETFPDADRALISTYWGQSVHGILFSEDITGITHTSNKVSFAKGLYQKLIFDRLSAEASKEVYLARD